MWQLQMVYTVDAVKTNVAEALEVLADAVLNPKFNPWEVKEMIAKMKGDLENMKTNPQTVMLEVSKICCLLVYVGLYATRCSVPFIESRNHSDPAVCVGPAPSCICCHAYVVSRA